MGRITMPHQLARLVLTEQIYLSLIHICDPDRARTDDPQRDRLVL